MWSQCCCIQSQPKQALLEREPPSGQVLLTLCGGEIWENGHAHPHRELMVLSYPLLLSQHASLQTPTNPKARRSLNSNHHLVKFFPCFVGGRMVMPSTQRANGALILTAIKSTRLVANANRPKGISAFSVSLGLRALPV